MRAGPEAASIAATQRPPRGGVGLTSGGGCVAGLRSTSKPRCRGRTSGRGLAEGEPGTPPSSVTVDAMADQPRPVPLVGLGERAPGEEDRGDRQLLGGQGPEVVGEQGGLLGRSSRRRQALGELAPATHGSMVYRARDGAEKLVSGGRSRVEGHPPPACPGQRGRLPALVRGPRDRPAGPLPGRADATRGDRALLRGPGRRTGRARDGRPRADDRPADRDLRVQPARRRERLGAVPHHDRRDRTPGATATGPRRRS